MKAEGIIDLVQGSYCRQIVEEQHKSTLFSVPPGFLCVGYAAHIHVAIATDRQQHRIRIQYQYRDLVNYIASC